MIEKLPCTKCGALILPRTAEKTGGLCLPCKQGRRESIEKAKEYYKKQKEYDPVSELWKSLVHRVYKTELGFGSLNDIEKLYYTVCILDGEVYNGGMHQFFTNSSGEYYNIVVDGLMELQAFESLKLLIEAKEILFGDSDIPRDRKERNQNIRDYPDQDAETTDWCIRLSDIEKKYWSDPDGLGEKLIAFAESHGLIEPFKIKTKDHSEQPNQGDGD